MRLMKFLQEATEKLDGWTEIEKLCPKTTAIKGLELYRGMEDYSLGSKYGKQDIKKDRIPKNTSCYFHDLLNRGFKAVFGVPVRNECVFCVSDIRHARTYGKVYKIWPSNDFKVYWSPFVRDIYALTATYLRGHEYVLSNLNTDSLKAFVLTHCVMAHKTGLAEEAQTEIYDSGLMDWVKLHFKKEWENCKERNGWKALENFAKHVNSTYKNGEIEFVRKFYKCGSTTQDLLTAAKSENELMITGSYYCWEQV